MSTNESSMADSVYAAAVESMLKKMQQQTDETIGRLMALPPPRLIGKASDFARGAFESFESIARYAPVLIEVSPRCSIALVADSSMAPGDVRLECRCGDAERISSRRSETSRVPRESNPTLADDSADWSAQLRAKVKASDERRARDRATPWDPWGDDDALSTNNQERP